MNVSDPKTPGYTTGATTIDGGHEHVDPLNAYITVFAALLVLLFATVGAYYIPFEKLGESWGVLNTVVALIIASIKASLVMLVFMHLRHGTRLTWVISCAGFVFLMIMICFFYSDYLSRNGIVERVPVVTNTRHNIDSAASRVPEYENPVP